MMILTLKLLCTMFYLGRVREPRNATKVDCQCVPQKNNFFSVSAGVVFEGSSLHTLLNARAGDFYNPTEFLPSGHCEKTQVPLGADLRADTRILISLLIVQNYQGCFDNVSLTNHPTNPLR